MIPKGRDPDRRGRGIPEALRETRTLDVIHDVSSLRSEIGILYLDDYNRKAIGKLLNDNELDFHSLIFCDAYVYLWKGHPPANRRGISFEALAS